MPLIIEGVAPVDVTLGESVDRYSDGVPVTVGDGTIDGHDKNGAGWPYVGSFEGDLAGPI